VRLNGKLLWIEQGHLMGGSDAMNSPRGLNGYTVCASLMFAGTTAARGTVDAVRASCAPVMGAQGTFGATQMKSMLLVRYLGNSSEVARRIMLAAWRVLRPSLLGREATELRIWNT
jgi:urease accessory protein